MIDRGSRGNRRDQAHRTILEPELERPSSAPETAAPPGVRKAADRERRRASDRARASGGILRFLVFAGLLGGIVLVGLGLVLSLVLRPLLVHAVSDFAANNPAALEWPFLAGLVREDLGADLTSAASDEPGQVEFVVEPGDSASTIANRLHEAGLLRNPRAFVFIAIERSLTDRLQAGVFVLRRTMTPDDLVSSLLEAKDPAIVLALRQGLRLEQITALLQTLPLQMDVRVFYELAKHPPAAILADYAWLELPAGASIEGFLGAGIFRILPDTTPEELIRKLLDRFFESIGNARMVVPMARGLSFYEIVILASIVEKEAALDDERALIAGVYQNRLRRKMLFNADPTVIFGNDSVQLVGLPFAQWQKFAFWLPVGRPLASVELPAELTGYQTYKVRGLIPGPICTPSAASIDAALEPDTADGYLYFVAKNDGSKSHAFAKTLEEHEKNLVKYGYR